MRLDLSVRLHVSNLLGSESQLIQKGNKYNGLLKALSLAVVYQSAIGFGAWIKYLPHDSITGSSRLPTGCRRFGK
jgi:hypothetical protein